MKSICDNKIFWKPARSSLSNKGNKVSKIALIENNTIGSDGRRVTDLINKYFINIEKLKSPAYNAAPDIDSILRTHVNRIRPNENTRTLS